MLVITLRYKLQYLSNAQAQRVGDGIGHAGGANHTVIIADALRLLAEFKVCVCLAIHLCAAAAAGGCVFVPLMVTSAFVAMVCALKLAVISVVTSMDFGGRVMVILLVVGT